MTFLDTLGAKNAQGGFVGKLGVAKPIINNSLHTGSNAPVVQNPMTDINVAGNTLYETVSGTGQSAGQTGAQRFNTGISALAGAPLNVVADLIPFGKSILNGIGGLFNSATNAVGNAFGSTPGLQKDVMQHPKIAGAVESVANVGVGLGNVANTALIGTGMTRGVQSTVNIAREVTPVIRTINSLANAYADARTLKSLTGTTLQPKGGVSDYAIPKAQEALSMIDTRGIKTYQDLTNALDSKISTISTARDEALQANTDSVPMTNLSLKRNIGGQEVAHNYVQDSINQLKDHYTATNDIPAFEKLIQLEHKANTEGLIAQDINNLAIEHGQAINAFNANGQAAAGLTKQAAENTRIGLKETVGGVFNSPVLKVSDPALSSLIKTRDLTQEMANKVTELQQKIQPRKLGEKVGRLVAQVANIIGLNSPKGFVEYFLGRGTGLKTLNALDLQSALEGNLKALQKALAPGASEATIESSLQTIIDNNQSTKSVLPVKNSQSLESANNGSPTTQIKTPNQNTNPMSASKMSISSKPTTPATKSTAPIVTKVENTAVATLATQKGGEVKSAFSNPEIGKIDLTWGTTEGEGGGLAKIIQEHPEVVNKLGDILQNAKVVGGRDGRIYLETSEGYRAVVRTDFNGTPKQWLLTAYKKVGQGEGNRTPYKSTQATRDTGSLHPDTVKPTTPATKSTAPITKNTGITPFVEQSRAFKNTNDYSQFLRKTYGDETRYAKVSDINVYEPKISEDTLNKYRQQFDSTKPANFGISVHEGKPNELIAGDGNHRLLVLKENGVEYTPVRITHGAETPPLNLTMNVDEFAQMIKEKSKALAPITPETSKIALESAQADYKAWSGKLSTAMDSGNTKDFNLAKNELTKARARIDEARNPTPITPKVENNPLAQEAQKYKSAEEFVNSQTKLLHGTDKKFDVFDPAKMGTNEKNFAAKSSFFFTDSLDTAKSYGKNLKEVYGKFDKPVTIDAEGKMFGDMRDIIDEAVTNAKKNGNDAVIIKNLSDRKDWGNYEPATHYAVFDTNKLMTKSQLIDFYNKVTKKK